MDRLVCQGVFVLRVCGAELPTLYLRVYLNERERDREASRSDLGMLKIHFRSQKIHFPNLIPIKRYLHGCLYSTRTTSFSDPICKDVCSSIGHRYRFQFSIAGRETRNVVWSDEERCVLRYLFVPTWTKSEWTVFRFENGNEHLSKWQKWPILQNVAAKIQVKKWHLQFCI